MTGVPCDPRPNSHRGFGHRDLLMHEFRVHGIPDIPIPDAPIPYLIALSSILRSMWPCTHISVVLWFPIGIRGFGVCDVNEHTPSGFPIPDLRAIRDLSPRVLVDGRSWSPLAISGFRTSRFRKAKVLCPRNPRYADSRFSNGFLMVSTCPSDGRLWLYRDFPDSSRMIDVIKPYIDYGDWLRVKFKLIFFCQVWPLGSRFRTSLWYQM